MKFLVVEDHALTREGVRLALRGLGDEVTVLDASNVEEALASIDQHRDIDLVLLDLGLPGTGGLSLLQALRRDQNTVPVVVISGAEERDRVIKALDWGASGFIPKSSSVEVMLKAVGLVLAGGIYIPQQALAPTLGRGDTVRADLRAVRDLTAQQTRILTLMAQGKPNKIVAAELNISEATVKSHVTDILRALKVTNRTQAVIVAGELGIT